MIRESKLSDWFDKITHIDFPVHTVEKNMLSDILNCSQKDLVSITGSQERELKKIYNRADFYFDKRNDNIYVVGKQWTFPEYEFPNTDNIFVVDGKDYGDDFMDNDRNNRFIIEVVAGKENPNFGETLRKAGIEFQTFDEFVNTHDFTDEIAFADKHNIEYSPTCEKIRETY